MLGSRRGLFSLAPGRRGDECQEVQISAGSEGLAALKCWSQHCQAAGDGSLCEMQALQGPQTTETSCIDCIKITGDTMCHLPVPSNIYQLQDQCLNTSKSRMQEEQRSDGCSRKGTLPGGNNHTILPNATTSAVQLGKHHPAPSCLLEAFSALPSKPAPTPSVW